MSIVRSGTAITLIMASCAYATALSAQGMEGQAAASGAQTYPSSGGTGSAGPADSNAVSDGAVSPPPAPPPPNGTYAPPPYAPPMGPPPVMMPPPPMPSQPYPAPAPSGNEQSTPEQGFNRAGTIGFGTSLSSGSASFPLSIGNQLNFRIWLGDVVALQPALVSSSSYVESTKVTAYHINPQLEALFAVYRGKTNRINLGIGLGATTRGVSKPATSSTISGTGGTSSVTTTTSTNEASETHVYVPFELQLEQFLAPWFSLQIGASCELIHYTNATSGALSTYNIVSETSSTKLQLGLMFYTF